jgi:hypothetical protein
VARKLHHLSESVAHSTPFSKANLVLVSLSSIICILLCDPSSLAFKEDFTSKATPLVPPMAQLSVKSVEPCPPWANKKEEKGGSKAFGWENGQSPLKFEGIT